MSDRQPQTTAEIAIRVAERFGVPVVILAVLLWISAFLSFLSEYLRPGEGMLSLGIAIVGVIAVNAVFTFIQEFRAEKALGALRRLLPFNVRVTRGGAVREMPGMKLCPATWSF